MFYIAALRTKRGDTGKSVLNCSADELMCVAFVRAHNNGLKGQKVTSRELMSISDPRKTHRARILHQRAQRAEELL